jgi:GT2 family glycosyltransferase
MNTPRVYIVVLNWNSASDTLECLESLMRVSYDDFQVVVCDNASTDDSATRIRAWANGTLEADAPSADLVHLMNASRRAPAPFVELDRQSAERGGTAESRGARVVLIHNDANHGFAGGNNVGLRYVLANRASDGHSLVCLLNNDTVVASDWLGRLIAAIESDRSIGAVGAMLFEYYEPELVESAGGGVVHPWQGMPRGTSATRQRRGTREAIPRRLDFLSGACTLMRTSTLEQIGLIDERFFLYCEDIELSLRMRRRGLRIALATDAEMWHKNGGSTRKQGARRDYYIVRNSLLLVHKLYPMFVPAAMLFSLYRCALPKLLRRDWARLRAVAGAYRDFFAFVGGNTSAAGVGPSVPPRPMT